ncbi:DUF2171 domain-containing protein [uncultured Sphingomonas sp.]|uniref:DUF2171 domain-containing protein n=1 Tax=uncultured Sphingomonas sp. TaxID=158754 RepID=UPI00261A4BDA|nr:DUF2171 domain-containing protein [uncultured Sphingomonas sp.]
MSYEFFGEKAMRYDRNPRRGDPSNFGRDYGSGRDYSYSSAREYLAAGMADADRARFERERYGPEAPLPEYHGSYASGGRRFEDVGHRRDWDDDERHAARHRDRGIRYARSARDDDYRDRGFLARAGDEVRSWFGDENAERRRQADMWSDERFGGAPASRDDVHYGDWRDAQIAALDRDYEEFRRENRVKFEQEFINWRANRQTQRDSLGRVVEHMEVVGMDGAHVGTVDKVRGDHIVLTKSDADAGGRHHSIPSGWIAEVDTRVTLIKTVEDVKQHWRDEDRDQARYGGGDRGGRWDRRL